MGKDHPLRPRFEAELEQLQKDLESMERDSSFRVVHRQTGGKDIDMTEASIARTKYYIDLYKRLLASDD